MNSKKVLIVDDEPAVRDVISSFLGEYDLDTVAAGTGEEALLLLNGNTISVALVDIKLPGMDGLQLLDAVKEVSPDTEVVIMTSYASLDTAIDAIRKDAYDYLQKPFEDLESVWVTVQRALEKRRLTMKNRELLLEMERRNRELSMAVKRKTSLIEAGRGMSGIHTVDELLDFFVELVANELGAERASLMLL
nr:response regulator [Deltaproteobacteria bacterium]